MRPIKILIGCILAVMVIACVALGTQGQSPITGVLREKPVEAQPGKADVDKGRVAFAIGLDIVLTTQDIAQYRQWSADMADAHTAEVRIRCNDRTVEMTYEDFLATVGLGHALGRTVTIISKVPVPIRLRTAKRAWKEVTPYGLIIMNNREPVRLTVTSRERLKGTLYFGHTSVPQSGKRLVFLVPPENN